MFNVLTVSSEDIIHHLKLSQQLPMILEGIATQKAIAEAATNAGMTVELEELQQTADAIRLSHNLRRTEDTWQWLQKQGLSLDQFEEMVYTTVLSAKLMQHLCADKVEPFFATHQLDYAQIVLYEVILDDADLALELFYALQEGELNFHDVAHQYIQEPELRRSGGYRGLLQRSDLKPEISAAVFAATPPQILKPILTAKGAHLILVEEIIQPQLDATMRYKIMSDLFAAWVKQNTKPVELAH
ncbi:MAG TPA: peptidylprolyl isomerase [Crinalium sp.]|jgi:parvulin-like peptidyl-prolyl isomerase